MLSFGTNLEKYIERIKCILNVPQNVKAPNKFSLSSSSS